MSTKESILSAALSISEGGVILCPTDTIWGLSADARNFDAVNKIFDVKKRPTQKSMIVLVSSLEMLRACVSEIPAVALNLIAKSTRPTSIIYPKGINLASNVVAENGSIAIRLVKHGKCHQLIQHLGYPIVSSSANLSGEPDPQNFGEVSIYLKNSVDYILEDTAINKQAAQASAIYLVEGDLLKQIR
jgi:L-threonylcarbamoyladenylate synthase